MRRCSVLHRPDWARTIPSRVVGLLVDPDSLSDVDVDRPLFGDEDRRNVALRLSILSLQEQLDDGSLSGADADLARTAITTFENVLVELNSGLLGHALKSLGGQYDALAEKARDNAYAQLGIRIQRWNPHRSPLSTWVKKALSGEVQKTLHQTKHETLPNRAYARRPEVVEAVSQLRERHEHATIRSILDHMRLTDEQARHVVELVSSGDHNEVENVYAGTLGPRRARRVATVAARLADQQQLDAATLVAEALPTADQVRDAVAPKRLLRTSTPIGGDDDDLTVGDTLAEQAEDTDRDVTVDLLSNDRFVERLGEHQLWFAIGKFQYGAGHAARETDLLQELGLTRGSAPTFKTQIADAGRQDGMVDPDVLARRLDHNDGCTCGADVASDDDYVACDDGCPARARREAAERRRQDRLADDIVDLLDVDADELAAV